MGYFTEFGYMGYIETENEWRLFSTEQEYREYIADD